MRINGDNGQYLEIEQSRFGDFEVPSDSDLLLNITVKVGGYSAADQFWTVSKNWELFLSQLLDLERSRKGVATLDGAESDDLRLVLQLTDRSGHMSITGHLGWDDTSGSSRRLEFGFTFDPGMLLTHIQEFEAMS